MRHTIPLNRPGLGEREVRRYDNALVQSSTVKQRAVNKRGLLKTQNTNLQARRPILRAKTVGANASVPSAVGPVAKAKTVPILRRELGEVLREVRLSRGCTLRQVSAQAKVSLGYLSEVERGQKEASSELLASICQALDAPLSVVLREVSERIALVEGFQIPDSIPEDMLALPARA